MQEFEFNTVGRIVSGGGSALKLAQECERLGVSRVLLITDPGLIALGLPQAPLDALQGAGIDVQVFDQVREDPPEETVLAAVDQAKNMGAEGVIGFGGSHLNILFVIPPESGSTEISSRVKPFHPSSSFKVSKSNSLTDS